MKTPALTGLKSTVVSTPTQPTGDAYHTTTLTLISYAKDDAIDLSECSSNNENFSQPTKSLLDHKLCIKQCVGFSFRQTPNLAMPKKFRPFNFILWQQSEPIAKLYRSAWKANMLMEHECKTNGLGILLHIYHVASDTNHRCSGSVFVDLGSFVVATKCHSASK